MMAKLSAYSDHSSFMRKRELSFEEFAAAEAKARRRLPVLAQDDQDIVDGFPHPKTSVCGALAYDSAAVGADGLEYRCGLQLGERGRAVGRIGARREDDSFADRAFWDAFDPTTAPTCSRCSFLPLCWGGCPKRHLDGSQADIDSEGQYWRTTLPRLIASGFGEQPPEGFAFSEADQFRPDLPR
jgi:uncharacterized protein